MSATVHAEIAKEAYFLWLQDGQTHGRAEHHWTVAEKLVAKRQVTISRVTTRKPATRRPRKPKLNS